MAGIRAVRPLALTAVTLAVAMGILLCASLISPTVALYAGSLPGVGPVLHALRLDRGLWLAYELNFAVRVNREVTDGEVVFRVHGLVADNIRTVLDYEVQLPAEYWSEIEQRETLPNSPWYVVLWDQWGNCYGWRPLWRFEDETVQAVRDMVVYRGNEEFRLVELRSRRMTAGLFVVPPELQLDSPEELLETAERLAMRLTFPVDFGPAASRSRVFYPNVSDEIDGVRATLLEVTAGATATRYRIAVEGLAHMGSGPLYDRVSLVGGVSGGEWVQTRWDGKEFTVLFPRPLVGPGTTTLTLAVNRTRDVDLALPVKRSPDGAPVPVELTLSDLSITLSDWSRNGDHLELQFLGEGAASQPAHISMLIAAPGGDQITVVATKRRYERSAYFYCPSRQSGIWLQIPSGQPDPQELRILAIQEPLSRELELTFEIPE
jgi:hypothetical protein